MEANPGMSVIRVANRDYPRYSDPNCHTCQSPHRDYIENQIMMGQAKAAIARTVAPLETGVFPPPSRRSISAHARATEPPHLIPPQAVRHRILEDREEELGSAIEGAESLVDMYVFNKMILAVGWEQFMAGDIRLSASDVMAAMQFQHKLDTTSNTGFDVQIVQDALEIYMDIATSFIPKDQLQEYAAELRGNQVLKALARKLRGEPDEPVIDVEVLDGNPEGM